MTSIEQLERFCNTIEQLLNETFAGHAHLEFQALSYTREGRDVILILLGYPDGKDDFPDRTPRTSSLVVDVPKKLDGVESDDEMKSLAFACAQPGFDTIEGLISRFEE